MRRKKFLALLLSTIMVLSIIPLGVMPVSADSGSPSGNWLDDGNYDISWYDGVSATTYEISTPEQLAGIAYLVNNVKASFDGMTIKLARDIDLSAHLWTPIDNAGLPDAPIFAGTFDGDGYTISNMTVNGSWRENGLFGRCDGYIQNLTMDNAVVEIPYGTKDSSVSVGVVCGMLYTCATNRAPSHIINCTVKNSTVRNTDGVNAGFIVGNRGGNPYPKLDNNKADKYISTNWIDDYDRILAEYFQEDKLGKTIEIYDELDYMAVLYLSAKDGVDFKGYTIKLMADLDMSAFKWEPFKIFAGTFEGNNHSIVGLNSETNTTGLVEKAEDGCKIQNLSLRVNLPRGNSGFIGFIREKAAVEVVNCRIFGSMSGNSLSGDQVGGIISEVDSYANVVVKRCQNHVALSSLDSSCGGIVGYVLGNIKIEECTNFGSITINAPYYRSMFYGAGGIVGEVNSGWWPCVTILRCGVPEKDLNNQPITITAIGNGRGQVTAGGFVGASRYFLRATDAITITDSYCNAKIIARGDAYAVGWVACNDNRWIPFINITGSYFGGTLLYIDSNGNESVEPNRLYFGFYFQNQDKGLSDTSVVKYNHCVVLHKENGKNVQNYNSLELSNISLKKENTPTWFNVNVTDKGTDFYKWQTAVLQKKYDLVTELNTKSGAENLWTNNNSFQSGLPYLTTSPSAYELASTSPIGAGALKITSVADSAVPGKSAYYKFPSETNPEIDVKNGLTLQLQTAYSKTENIKFNDEYLIFINRTKEQTPLVNGDIVTMYTLSADKSTVTGTYTYTASDSNIQKGNVNFKGGTLIRLTYFKDKNGKAYTGSPDETRSMYFTVDFKDSDKRNLEDFSVIYELVTHSAQRSYMSCIYKEVPFKLVDKDDIELSADTPQNGTISFYNGENTGYSGDNGVVTMISPKEGYQVAEAWITDDSDDTNARISLDAAYNFSTPGFSFVWKKPGKYTVHATFEPKELSVVFNGEGCSNGNAQDTVLYGEAYTFSINYESGYAPVGENPVTVNGQPVSADGSGKYTVADNKDAVRIKVSTKAKAATSISVEPDATSLTYGESVTLTAALKEGENALSGKTVDFYDGVDFAGSTKTDGNGIAEYTVMRPKAVEHNFKAVFSGDDDYNNATDTTAEVVVSKRVLTVWVEPVIINEGERIPTLTVKIGADFVQGESAGTLTGFALPTASASGTVDTQNTSLKSFDVTYSGGNPTDNYQFDLSNTTVAITINAAEAIFADYSEVDAAIAKIPADLSVYTEASVNALIDAQNAVIRGKDISEQETVDGYAADIENAIKALAYAITNSLTNITSGNLSTSRLASDITSYTATLTADSGYQLPAGITVEVGGVPLTAGATTYEYDSASGALTIYAESITGGIDITAGGIANSYAITAAPASLDFGSADTGYTQIAAQTVTITNTGNESVTVALPTSTSYTIEAATGFSDGSAVLAANGATATFTVQPNAGLAAGTHDEAISISGTNSTSASVDAAFTVQKQSDSSGGKTTYYTLTAATNGGSEISAITRAKHTTIDLTTDSYIPERKGYEFTGWYSDAELTNNITKVILTKDTTIYAGWSDKTNTGIGVINPFADVSESDWFFSDVMFVYANKLMLGTSDTTFSPYDTTTRAMVASIILRMEGSPDVTGSSGFSDVADGKWYTDAITWTKQKDIVKGYSDTLFGPDETVTREQLAAFFYRYAQYKGYDTTISGNISSFKDNEAVSDWAVPAMKRAVGQSVIQGKTGGLLDPQGDATRAELAAMLHRFIDKNEPE